MADSLLARALPRAAAQAHTWARATGCICGASSGWGMPFSSSAPLQDHHHLATAQTRAEPASSSGRSSSSFVAAAYSLSRRVGAFGASRLQRGSPLSAGRYAAVVPLAGGPQPAPCTPSQSSLCSTGSRGFAAAAAAEDSGGAPAQVDPPASADDGSYNGNRRYLTTPGLAEIDRSTRRRLIDPPQFLAVEFFPSGAVTEHKQVRRRPRHGFIAAQRDIVAGVAGYGRLRAALPQSLVLCTAVATIKHCKPRLLVPALRKPAFVVSAQCDCIERQQLGARFICCW